VPTPTIAIIGRPNVGKSTLFNCLVKKRRAIVHDYSGVTRDRVVDSAVHRERRLIFIDTGGFEPDAEDLLKRHIARQVELAAELADLVLLVVDGRDGLNPLDEDCARRIRKLERPCLLVVNKIERERDRFAHSDFCRLGIEKIFPISALHRRGLADLLDVILDYFPAAPESEEERPYCSLAIVGKPNVGKSSLVNALLGDERQIVTPIPGTTRDAVDSELTYYGQSYRLIDTAGIRRKSRVTWALEKLSVLMATRSIERADVALVVLDATEGITDQDAKIAGLAHESGRGAMVVVNKWDLLQKETNTARNFERLIRDEFKFLAYAPIIFVSCESGQRLHKVLETAAHIRQQQDFRIPTPDLNRLIDGAYRGIPPPHKGSKKLKLFYATQVSSRPPTFVLFCNAPDRVHFSYERYLINQIRQVYPYTGLPIRLLWRPRSRGMGEQPAP
jgi:GTPase